jgi:hypothetical protein
MEAQKLIFNTEKHYRVEGNIYNGTNKDGTKLICKENVVRKIKYMTDTKLVTECGREFIKDNELSIEELNY